MSNFSLLRTNVGLSGNVKLIVDSQNNMYLETIDSSFILSNDKFKKFKINKDSYYGDLLSNFFKDLESDVIFKIIKNDDSDKMFNDYKYQIDDTYLSGALSIQNNKDYKEEFEYFAPIYIDGSLPKLFIIFRVDGAGFINLNKENFKEEIIDKLKVVKSFDLRNNNIGEWLANNFTENKYFPKTPIYIDFRNLEFSYTNGIDIETGGFIQSPLFLENYSINEREIYDFQKYIYSQYEKNKIIFPNILNLSFLFDDEPATKSGLRKWSINRYYGFYIDEVVNYKSFGFYRPNDLIDNLEILEGNQLSEFPFKESWKWREDSIIQVNGIYYKIRKNDLGYKVISDLDLSGLTQSSFNNSILYIDDDNKIHGLDIPDYETSDVWMLNISNNYFKILKKEDDYFVNCDGGFRIKENVIEYFINEPSVEGVKKINIKENNSSPINFKIVKIKFSDIKDFDNDIVDTKFSRYEYEYLDKLNITDEYKLYLENLSDTSDPKELDIYDISGELVNVPVSSEYTTNGETFKIEKDKLSDIWSKNPDFVKWKYKGSISSHDYPYLLNNSFIIGEFNNDTNPFNPNPNRYDRNLDYFYSINSSNNNYSFHSLHIQDEDPDFKFDVEEYLTADYDYFTEFFGKTYSLSDGVYKSNKWSTFNNVDNSIPNDTLFRGIKFNISNVEKIEISDFGIKSITLENNNYFNEWKFSILLDEDGIDPVTTTTTTTTTTSTTTLAPQVV